MANIPHSDALVFFGATGDLAYKQIFPALQALVSRHNYFYEPNSWGPVEADQLNLTPLCQCD